MDVTEEDIKLLEATLAAFRDEYEEHWNVWKTLESKAQVAITVSGFLLAAAFAFVHQADLEPASRILVGLVLLSLLLALLGALYVMQVAETEMPVDGAHAIRKCRTLLDTSNKEVASGQRYRSLLLEMMEGTEAALVEIDGVNERKRGRLAFAYGCLVIAAICSVVVGMMRVVPPLCQ